MITGSVGSLKSTYGKLEKASDYAEEVIRFQLLLILLTSVVIPKEHVRQVIGDIEHQRSICDDVQMMEVSAALTEVIDKLNDTTDESD